MPSKSPAEHRAMEAAAHGHSTLGIPASVGKEFVAADRHDALAAPPEGLNDYEIAEGMRDGLYASPQKIGEFWLFDMRVTGTGVAFRDSIGEFAVRDPGLWLSDAFVKRAASVPVIFEHPPGHGLDSDEYRERSLGNAMLSYVKGDEVRCVAKIFDADGATLMQSEYISTSPGVITDSEGPEAIILESGARVLAEGLPLILDHLAVCKVGVWDKGGPPDGIRLDSQKEQPVAEKDEPKFDMSTAEGRKDARTWLDSKDAEERKDAMGDEMDDSKKDGKKDAADDEKDDSKKDSTDEEAEKKAKELEEHERDEIAGKKDKKDAAEEGAAKNDGAAKEVVDVERGTVIKDSAAHALIQSQAKTIAGLQTQMDAMRTPPSPEEGSKLSTAFHRADSLFQSLGETTPKPYPGELSTSYRRRLVGLLRPHAGPKFKALAIHDALDDTTFGVVEDTIYDAAKATASESKAVPGAKLREIATTRHGKTTVKFIGDSNEAWAPFTPPVRNFVTAIHRNPGMAR